MFSSAAPEFSAKGCAGGTPWGPGAEAESCTHPAKRDRCFPPPIAERQRLPNVGIKWLFPTIDGHLMWFKFWHVSIFAYTDWRHDVLIHFRNISDRYYRRLYNSKSMFYFSTNIQQWNGVGPCVSSRNELWIFVYDWSLSILWYCDLNCVYMYHTTIQVLQKKSCMLIQIFNDDWNIRHHAKFWLKFPISSKCSYLNYYSTITIIVCP